MNEPIFSNSEVSGWIDDVYGAIAEILDETVDLSLPQLTELAKQIVASAKACLFRHGSPPWLLLPAAVGDAVAASRRATVQVAAGFELARLAAGVLDQCIDQDTDDALWLKVGMGQAMTLSTALTSLALLVAGRVSRHGVSQDTAARVTEAFQLTWLRMAEGQQQELAVAARDDVSEPIYWQIAGAKSGKFFELGCRAAALLAENLASATMDAFSEFGNQVGIMIQLANDLQGFWAFDGKKDVGQRLTLPIIYTREMLTDDDERGKLERLLPHAVADNNAAAECRALIEKSGGVHYTLMQMKFYHDRAEGCLSRCPPSTLLPKLLEAWFPLSVNPPANGDV